MNRRYFALLALLVTALLLAACGTETAPTPTPAAAKLTLDDSLIHDVTGLNQGTDVKSPLDSTPDPDGANVYFTATGGQGPGVFRVAMNGGTPNQVAAGSPFVAPRALAISLDGKQLFVTDPQAGSGGQIFVVPVGGGSPTPLKGSAGTTPQNVTVRNDSGQLTVYFTGKDPADKQPAVLKLAAAGADAPQVVAKGAPLVDPDGIAAADAGPLYVADRTAGNGAGKVFKIDNGTVSALVDKVRLGNPGGTALVKGQSLLVVSAVQADKDYDEVLVVDVATGQSGVITKAVGQNTHAGGVHAVAGHDDVFSWADLTAGGGGGVVYRIR